jgi:PAB-dependent poly(A)-specific ribonuclease subunit 2
LPGEGDLIALDAEFVSVQEEDVEMSESGDKLVIRETRHVLARVSVIDCRTERVIIDDYVLPKEPVVDYLTRFSGIHPEDLDPKTSPHHLITARTAYLKLRYLVERGCIFVGHGLSTDFSTVNLFVPPRQIIDTVEIYRIEQRRHISLRFLANYVLKRDTQQDTHDSIEDAKTAYDLYKHALALTAKNNFEKFLRDLYQYGDRTEWRLGFSPLL